MDDSNIIELFFKRDQDAIAQTEAKYGNLCRFIAMNILGNASDSEECENDALLRAWNSIPPSKPASLKAYLIALTRHISLDRYRFNNAEKRSVKLSEALDELSLCLSSDSLMPEDALIYSELINRFLGSLKKQHRIIFLQRYYYFCSVREISAMLSLSESNVKVTLMRTREKLKAMLESEGISI